MTLEGKVVNKLHKDEDLREKNFDIFEKRYGFRPQITSDEDEQYRIETAQSGDAVVCIKSAPLKYIRLNSSYSPHYEAERWVQKFEVVNRRTTVALLGFSNGSFVRALKQNFRPDTTFYILEPEEALFSFVCSYIDITDLIENDQIRIYVTDAQRARFADDLLGEATTVRSEIHKIVTPFYSEDEIFDNACASVGRIMRSNNAFLRSRSRKVLRARLYAWNRMRYAYLLPELAEAIPDGIPAVIVAAGPSLRKNVEALKKIKRKALIICTDRAASVLNSHGIVPDFVASFDAEKNPDFLDYDVLEGVPLICSYQVNIETQKRYKGRMIFMHALSYENELFGSKAGSREKGADLGGNVAGGSFVACEMLGIKTIILVGQDLAYLEGKHHADDRADGTPNEEIKETKGINGETVLTNDSWLTFKNFYERQIVKFPELRVIDATEGGAYIEGTEIMSLNEVAENVCTRVYEIGGFLKSVPKAQDEKDYEESVGLLKKWISDLEMISRNSKELSDICHQMVNECKYHDITNPKLSGKFRRIETLLNEFLPTQSYKMLKEFWIEDMYSIPDNRFMVRNNEEALPVFENAEKFYSQLPRDCEGLTQEIRMAIEEGKKDNEPSSD